MLNLKVMPSSPGLALGIMFFKALYSSILFPLFGFGRLERNVDSSFFDMIKTVYRDATN